MSNYTAILPGARVRTKDGIIGTVERLEQHAPQGSDGPDHMVVRSDDGRWRYSLPLMLVGSVTQDTFHTVVQLRLDSLDLVHYVAGQASEQAGTTAPETSAESPVTTAQWSASPDDETLRIPLAAEELVAHKRAVALGKVHLHKGVETVEQSSTVPVYHEEAIVEHLRPDEYDGTQPDNPNEVIIPILEEQLVVEKRTVVKEYLRVRKNLVTQHQDIHDSVRREFVEVTEQRYDGPKTGGAPLVNSAELGGAASSDNQADALTTP